MKKVFCPIRCADDRRVKTEVLIEFDDELKNLSIQYDDPAPNLDDLANGLFCFFKQFNLVWDKCVTECYEYDDAISVVSILSHEFNLDGHRWRVLFILGDEIGMIGSFRLEKFRCNEWITISSTNPELDKIDAKENIFQINGEVVEKDEFDLYFTLNTEGDQQ